MSTLAQRRRPLPVTLAEFSKHLLIVGVCVALLFPMLLMLVMSLKIKGWTNREELKDNLLFVFE